MLVRIKNGFYVALHERTRQQEPTRAGFVTINIHVCMMCHNSSAKLARKGDFVPYSMKNVHTLCHHGRKINYGKTTSRPKTSFLHQICAVEAMATEIFAHATPMPSSSPRASRYRAAATLKSSESTRWSAFSIPAMVTPSPSGTKEYPEDLSRVFRGRVP